VDIRILATVLLVTCNGFLFAQVTEDKTEFNTPLLLFIVGVVITVIGWLLARAINSQDEKISEIGVGVEKNIEKIEKLETKLNDVNLAILKEISGMGIKLEQYNNKNK